MTTVLPSGLWPHAAAQDHLTAQLQILEDSQTAPWGVTAVPFIPLYPSHPHFTLTARTLGTLVDLGFEEGPHGWKLSSHRGLDAQRVLRALEDQYEALSIAAHGTSTPLTVSVLGPWTLASQLWLNHGDRVLADHGAVRDVASALGEGLSHLVARIGQLVPGVSVHVQVDETNIASVLAGVVPTFSGYSRLPRVEPSVAIEALQRTLRPVMAQAGVTVHTGESWVGIPTAARAIEELTGVSSQGEQTRPALGVNLGAWNEQVWESIATCVERGIGFHGALPAPQESSCAGVDIRGLGDVLATNWQRIGLPVSGLTDVSIGYQHTAATSIATGSVDDARGKVHTLIKTAEYVAEKATA